MTNLFVQMFAGLIWERNLCVVLDQLSGIPCFHDKIKSSPNINVFKAALESWIPDNCRCKLCQVFVPQLGYVDLFE